MPGPFDELEKEAERLEKQSKEEFNDKNFVSSISLLEEARGIYAELDFQGKIRMINQRISRIKNLIKHETKESMITTKDETEFQKRVDKVLEEKETYEKKKNLEQNTRPPELKRKLEKVVMILEKAEKEEKLGKYSRVIGRYKHILEIYRAIPKEVMNLSNEIYRIEKKLSTLRSKKYI